MKPNLLFFLIDGLRADQCFGKDKTSFTPNIDRLRKNGAYFTNAFSSVDGTFLSLNAIFHSLYPFKTGTGAKKITLQKNNLFGLLAKNGYQINGLVPNILSLADLVNYFENNDKTYNYFEDMSKDKPVFTEYLSTGLTDKIINFLKSKILKNPWLYYAHLMDLHPLKEYYENANHARVNLPLPQGIKDFDDEKFGASIYERTLTLIDSELGKILEHVDLDNTILILTADHGERIAYGGIHENDFQPKLEPAVEFGKKFLPKSTHKTGGQFLSKIRSNIGKQKLNQANKNLTEYQKRSRKQFSKVSLFDEMLHVPLLFANNHMNSRTVPDLVHNADIYPTICELVEINFNQIIHGRSLVTLIQGNKIEEKPIYLRTRPYLKPNKLDSIGVRSSNYKYFRSAHDPKENVHLYDLKNDPHENNNIAKINKKIVEEFEDLLVEMRKYSSTQCKDEENPEESSKIEYELKKMGYID